MYYTATNLDFITLLYRLGACLYIINFTTNYLDLIDLITYSVITTYTIGQDRIETI